MATAELGEARGAAALLVTFERPPAARKVFRLEEPPRVVLDFHRQAPRVPAAAPPGEPAPGPEPLRTIVVDPGHGGHDVGAVGPSGLQEKELALDIARRVAALLQEELGVRVVLTRARDQFVGLRERTTLANRERADLFLSIHVNASPAAAATGTETYFLSNEATDGAARRAAEYENRLIATDTGPKSGAPEVVRSILWDLAQSDFQQESSRVAEALQNHLDRALRRPSRGVKQAPFYVLGGAAMPAVLVEIGFISNAAGGAAAPGRRLPRPDRPSPRRRGRRLQAWLRPAGRGAGAPMTRHDGRAPGDLRPVRLTRRYTHARRGRRPGGGRRHPGHLHGVGRGPRAAVPPRERPGLGHGGVRHAPARHVHPDGPRGGADRRPDARDPAAGRPLPARGRAARPARRAHDHRRL